jgi:hypothetical protein
MNPLPSSIKITSFPVKTRARTGRYAEWDETAFYARGLDAARFVPEYG